MWAQGGRPKMARSALFCILTRRSAHDAGKLAMKEFEPYIRLDIITEE